MSSRIYDSLDVLNACRHKFEGIFDMHGVRTGSSEDVPGFLDKLHENRYFAMDFWGLVASLEAMGDRISERQIRRAVMDCVCGEWLPNDDPASIAINEAFDARVRQSEPLTSHEAAVAGEAMADNAGTQIVEPRIEALEDAHPVMAETEVLPEVVAEVVPEIMQSEAEPASVLHEQQPVLELGNVGTSSADHIDQVLSRLELINLELKLHLDNIDSRVSRLEPHIEELASQVVRSLELAAAAAAEAAGKVVPVAETRMVTDELLPVMVPVAEPRMVTEELPPVVVPVMEQRMVREKLPPVVPTAPVASVPVAEAAAAAEPRVSDDIWPAVDWVGKARSLRGAGMALGVAACLALVIWLWERPRAEVAPVASTAVVGAAAAPKVEPAKPAVTEVVAKQPSANAVKEEVQAEIAATIHKAAAVDDPGAAKANDTVAANVARDGVEKAPLKTHSGTGVKGEGDYAAPPWTKWYGGAPQGKTVRADGSATTGAKSEIR